MPDLMAVLRANTSDFSAKMAEAKAETDDLSKSGSSNFSKMSTIGGAALAGIGAAILGVGAVSVDLGMKFQSTTATIANNAGISTAAAQKIGNAFLNTAGSTIFSGQQIATAYASVAGQLTATQGHALSTKQAMDVMRASMDLAEASGIDLGTATSAMAATMQAYGEKANDAASVSNILFNASRLTGTGVDTLSAALDKAKTKLGGMAPPLNQMGGLLVDMAQHGETGRAAMSALTTSFTAFLKPASDMATAQANLHAATVALPPSLQGLAAAVTNGTMSSQAATTAAEGLGTAQAALFSKFTSATTAAATAGEAQTKMGVTAVDASGKMKPLGSIIGQLQTQIKGMGTAQAIAQLTADGFSGASAKLVSVVQAGPAAFDKATASVDKANSAHQAAVRQSATLKDQLETLKSSAEDYATKLGGVLIPKIQSVISFLMKHKDVAIIVVAVVVAGVAAMIGMWIAGAIAAMSFWAAATGGIIILVAALAVGIAWIVSHWQETWDFVKRIFDDAVKFLRSGFGTLVVLLTGPLAPLIELALHWQTVFGIVKDAVRDAWVVIGPIFDFVKTAISVYLTAAIDVFKTEWQVAWTVISTVVDAAWDYISAVIKVALDIIIGVVKVFIDLFTGNWSGAWNAIRNMVTQVWNDIVSFFGGIPAKLINAIASFAGEFLGWITDAFTAFASWVLGAWAAEIAFWTALPVKIINAVISFGALLLNWITMAWNTFKAWIEGAWNAEIAFWSGIPSKIISAVSALGGDLLSWITEAWGQVTSGLGAAWSDTSSWLGGIPGRVTSAIGDLGSTLYNAGKALLEGLLNGIKAAFNDVASFVSGIAGKIASLKGPLDYDATLLVPHGNAIMQGLADGLQQGFNGKVAPLMSGVAGAISGATFGGTASLGASGGITPLPNLAGGAAAAGGGGMTAQVAVNVTLDNAPFIQALQTAVLQYQRGTASPVFGSSQTAAA